MNDQKLETVIDNRIAHEVTTANLGKLIESLNHETAILSLDCFDTLIWRKCAEPTDVFYDLQHYPSFKRLHFDAGLRISAEHQARQQQWIEKGSREVTLKDIYLAAFPTLTDEDINELSKEEVSCEIEHCFAYQPMVALLQQAAEFAKTVIIVSDTYFSQIQLRQILNACLPNDLKLIKHIFVSNEWGVGKSEGIFSLVCNKINTHPKSILHLGDNLIADYQIPAKAGVNAYRFVAISDYLIQVTRMQNIMTALYDPTVRSQKPLYQIYRSLFAATQPNSAQPETAVGYIALGPILHAFSHFLIQEYNALKKQYPNLKVGFLLRDGYLPWLATQALNGQKIGEQIRISRFAAYAASFCSKNDIRNYVASVISGKRYKDICKQLLLPKNYIDKLLQKMEQAKNPLDYFSQAILSPESIKIIVDASQKYRTRLLKYLKNSLQLEMGDTLLLVDLGYSCTTQRQLQSVLRSEMNVTLIGRYLLSLRTPDWYSQRKGLVDANWCDDNSMLMTVTYIALLEQLCTTVDESVIDFDNDGNPIYAEATLSSDQYQKLTKIQNECIKFIYDAKKHLLIHEKYHFAYKALEHTALAALGRLIFLPTQIEMNYLQTFKFDLNLGTEDTFTMFNPMLGLIGLRQRGLFFMERSSKQMRTNYPAELRHAGLELALSLMSQHRFNFEFSINDMSLRRENLEIIVLNEKESSKHLIQAHPTFDGYFAVIIPINNAGNQHIGILLGEKYKWIQIETISLIKLRHLYTENESLYTEDASSLVTMDNMKKYDGNLYQAESRTSLIMLKSPFIKDKDYYVFRFVYRPIIINEQPTTPLLD